MELGLGCRWGARCWVGGCLALVLAIPLTAQAAEETLDGRGSVLVRDRDYQPNQPALGVSSVWSSDGQRLQVLVQYCVADLSIFRSSAHLSTVTLLTQNQPLLTLNTALRTQEAQPRLVQPARRVFGGDSSTEPIGDVFRSRSIYTPAVICSTGESLFDVTPTRDQLRQLPDQRLQVRLTFSNGSVQDWHLGQNTVRSLKQLPSLPQAPSP